MNFHHYRNSRLLRWVFRFRKRCGYGIHSPFAFNFVTGVIYESGEYYAYADLTKLSAKEESHLRLKDNRLLFRMVNFQNPEYGLMLAPDLGLTASYMRAAKTSCRWTVKDQVDSFLISLPLHQFDFVYAEAEFMTPEIWSALCACSHPLSMMVIHGIHATDTSYRYWKHCISDAQVRVTFDLFDFGILFFEERLNKENYTINYY